MTPTPDPAPELPCPKCHARMQPQFVHAGETQPSFWYCISCNHQHFPGDEAPNPIAVPAPEVKACHHLKTWPAFFRAIETGLKHFEARLNDRDFKSGDVLHIQEWNPETKEYTGRELVREVSYVLYGPAFGVESGHCIMSLIPLTPAPSDWMREAAESLAQMVVEWVQGGMRMQTDWRNGLADVLQRRLARHAPDVAKLESEVQTWRKNAADLWPLAKAWATHWQGSPYYGNGTESPVHAEILERTKQ